MLKYCKGRNVTKGEKANINLDVPSNSCHAPIVGDGVGLLDDRRAPMLLSRLSYMKMYALFLGLLLCSARVLAADVELLDISDPEHPKLINDKVGSVTLISKDTNDLRYALDIRTRPQRSFSVPYWQIVLKVGGEKLYFNSGERGKGFFGEDESIGMIIFDPTNAIVPLIAKQFDAKVISRKAPSHQMLVQFIPEKEEYIAGEPVIVTLRITNVGEREFAFEQGGRQRGARDNQFTFTAQRVALWKGAGGVAVPDTGKPMHRGGLSVTRTLKPSQSWDIKVNLAKWFKFEDGSIYYIRGSYEMTFVEPIHDATQMLLEDGPRPLWDDFACGEFTIRTAPQLAL